MKRLVRRKEDTMVAGVCGAIGRYFNIDPTIIRILWAMTFLFKGAGIGAYIIAALVIPSED